jgi:hypothetical protein
MGPEGAVYVLTDAATGGKLLKLTPKSSGANRGAPPPAIASHHIDLIVFVSIA